MEPTLKESFRSISSRTNLQIYLKYNNTFFHTILNRLLLVVKTTKKTTQSNVIEYFCVFHKILSILF